MTSNFLNNDGAKKGSRRSGKRPVKKVKSRSLRRRRTPSKARVVAGRRRSTSRRRSVSRKVRKSVSRRRKVSSGPRRRRSASRRSRRSRPRMSEAQKSARRAVLNKRALQNCTQYGMLSEECWKSLMPLSSQAKSNIRDIVRRIKTERSYERPSRLSSVPSPPLNLPKLPDVIKLINREVVDSNDIILQNPELKSVLNSYIERVLRIDRNSGLGQELYSSSNPAVKLLSKLSDDLRDYLKSSDSTSNKKAKLMDFLEKLGGSGVVAAGASFKVCGEAEILYHVDIILQNDTSNASIEKKDKLLDTETQVLTKNKAEKLYNQLKKDVKSCSFNLSFREFENLLNVKSNYSVEDETHFKISKFLFKATHNSGGNVDNDAELSKVISNAVGVTSYQFGPKFLNTLGSIFSSQIIDDFAKVGDVDNLSYVKNNKDNAVQLIEGLIKEFIKKNKDLVKSKAIDSIFECSVDTIFRELSNDTNFQTAAFKGSLSEDEVTKFYDKLKTNLKGCTVYARDKFETELKSRGFTIHKQLIAEFLDFVRDVQNFPVIYKKVTNDSTSLNTTDYPDKLEKDAKLIYSSLPVVIYKNLTEDSAKQLLLTPKDKFNKSTNNFSLTEVSAYMDSIKTSVVANSKDYIDFCGCKEMVDKMVTLYPHRIITYSVLASFLSLLRGVKLNCNLSSSVNNIILEKCIQTEGFKVFDFDTLKKKYDENDTELMKHIKDSKNTITAAAGTSFTQTQLLQFGNLQLSSLEKFERDLNSSEKANLLSLLGDITPEQMAELIFQQNGKDPDKTMRMLENKTGLKLDPGVSWRQAIIDNPKMYASVAASLVLIGTVAYMTGGDYRKLLEFKNYVELAKKAGINIENWNYENIKGWFSTNYNRISQYASQLGFSSYIPTAVTGYFSSFFGSKDEALAKALAETEAKAKAEAEAKAKAEAEAKAKAT